MLTSNRSPLMSNRVKETKIRPGEIYRHSSTKERENEMILAEIFPCNNPCSPNMADFNQRYATFNNWPNHINASPRALAEAGFIYLGVDDKLKCFYCNGGLQRWQKHEDAFSEHAKWYPNCEYVLRKKGIDYVQNIASKFPNLKRPVPTNQQPNNSQVYTGPNVSQVSTISSSSSSFTRSSSLAPKTEADDISSTAIQRAAIRKAMENERVKQTIGMGFDEDIVYEVVKRKLVNENEEYASILELVEDAQIEEEKASSLSSFQSQVPLYSCSSNNCETPQSSMSSSYAQSSSFKQEQNILDSVGSDTTESMPSTSKGAEDLLQNMLDERTCKVCLDRVSNCVFQPCGHVCCCVQCSSALKKCPICRQTLHKVYKFYR